MKEIKAVIQAQRLSKVVLAMQATGLFPGVSVAEVRRIGQDAPSGIGGIADRLMDPTPYIKMELLCVDEDSDRLLEAIRRTADAGKDGSGLVYVCAVESSTAVFSRDVKTGGL